MYGEKGERTVRIYDNQNIGKLQAYQKQTTQKNNAGNKGEANRQYDQISISNQAQELRVQSESIEAVSAERLNEIKQEVTNGTYQIDPRAIAAKMVARLFGEE